MYRADVLPGVYKRVDAFAGSAAAAVAVAASVDFQGDCFDVILVIRHCLVVHQSHINICDNYLL